MTSDPHLRSPDGSHRRQKWGTVESTDLRIEQSAATQIVEALNSELSGLYILFNQVRKHYWLVKGAESDDISEFLVAAAERLSEITDDFGIRVHALGGVPVCGPMGIRQHASLYIEAPHSYDIRSSLERDLEGYVTLAELWRTHIEQVEQLGDPATGELFRRHLKTLERDAHRLEKLLADDTLVLRDAMG